MVDGSIQVRNQGRFKWVQCTQYISGWTP